MTIGTLEQLFEFELKGIEVQTEVRFHVPGLGLEAQLQTGTPLSLSVRIEGASELTAEARAASFVQELYRRMLLRFSANIQGAARPRRIQQRFNTGPTTKLSVAVASAMHQFDASIGIPALVPSSAELEALAHDVEVRVVTPQPATSAQLYTAIAMYTVGMESQNKVVRFLVFYSALGLAALFRWHNGEQRSIDRLLLETNPQLVLLPSPKKSNFSETLYTKLRNDLIHAEERGCDPASAIAAIETHIEQFQRDASLVFSNL